MSLASGLHSSQDASDIVADRIAAGADLNAADASENKRTALHMCRGAETIEALVAGGDHGRLPASSLAARAALLTLYGAVSQALTRTGWMAGD